MSLLTQKRALKRLTTRVATLEAQFAQGGVTGPMGPRGPRGSAGASATAPAGAIVVWSGLLADIPSGWVLCDGTNGTPDLRDQFIRGAAPGQEPGPGGSL